MSCALDKLTEHCPFGEELIEIANSLTDRIEHTGDYQVDHNLPYGRQLAARRHEHTNYDDLLHELPPCTDHMDSAPESRERCIRLCVDEFGNPANCPYREEAHDILKRACSY
jgi:hypothetical protein